MNEKDKLIKELINSSKGNSDMLDFLMASDEYWFENADLNDIKEHVLDNMQNEYVEGTYADGRTVEDIFKQRIEHTTEKELKEVLEILGSYS